MFSLITADDIELVQGPGSKNVEAAIVSTPANIVQACCPKLPPPPQSPSRTFVLALASFHQSRPAADPRSRPPFQLQATKGIHDVQIDEKRLTVKVSGYDQSTVDKARDRLEIGHVAVQVEKKLYAEVLSTSAEILTALADEAWSMRGVRLEWTRDSGNKGKAKKGNKKPPLNCKFTISGLKAALTDVEVSPSLWSGQSWTMRSAVIHRLPCNHRVKSTSWWIWSKSSGKSGSCGRKKRSRR